MRAEKSKLLAYDHSQQQNEDHKHIHGTFHTKILLICLFFDLVIVCLAAVSDLEANAIGYQTVPCNFLSIAPSPNFDASHVILIGGFLSKNFKVCVFATDCFNLLKASI